ncbi:hypothetical protein CDAR_223281 [Caerostris darwini]|uniref:Uncharacterized protein n=1 Tax=Caerostris darwini TaxID=1538125 RepID=A0AAV4W7A7_9ARAC|nr:hypothetical protein CDAR_223281 [Caerostris darwini]
MTQLKGGAQLIRRKTHLHGVCAPAPENYITREINSAGLPNDGAFCATAGESCAPFRATGLCSLSVTPSQGPCDILQSSRLRCDLTVYPETWVLIFTLYTVETRVLTRIVDR